MPKTLSAEDLGTLREMHRAVSIEKFKYEQVKGNTALVPRGQEIAKELEAIVTLLENAKNGWIAQKLKELGFAEGQKVGLDLTTGTITPV